MQRDFTRIYAADVSNLKDDTLYQTAYQKVTADRRTKTDALRLPSDKYLSLGAELLLIEGLEALGIKREDVSYDYGAQGKPMLKGEKPIYFNLSHSGERAVCAISSKEIGCDIEKITDKNLKAAQYVFSEKEYQLYASQKTEEEKQDMFFRLWTLKESFVKLLGTGIQLPMNSFSVCPEQDKITIRQEVDERTCYFRELSFWKDYKCSVCGFDEHIASGEELCFEILHFFDILMTEQKETDGK